MLYNYLVFLFLILFYSISFIHTKPNAEMEDVPLDILTTTISNPVVLATLTCVSKYFRNGISISKEYIINAIKHNSEIIYSPYARVPCTSKHLLYTVIQDYPELIKSINISQLIEAKYFDQSHIIIPILLLQLEENVINQQIDNIFKLVLINNQTKVLKWLFYNHNLKDMIEDISVNDEILLKMIRNGYVEIWKILFQYSRKYNYAFIDLTRNSYNLMIVAVDYNQVEILDLFINEMIKKHSNFDISFNNHILIKLSVKNCYIDMFKYLIQNRQIKPSFNNNIAIQIACRNKCLDIVQFIIKLNDENVDITINNNYPFLISMEKSHIEIAEYLLKKDKKNKINFVSKQNNIIEQICKSGYYNLFMLIIKKYNINPTLANNNCCLIKSCFNNQENIVHSLFLHFPNMDIISNRFEAVKNAVLSDNINILNYFFEQSKIKNKQIDTNDKIVEQRIYPNMKNDMLLRHACRWGKINIVKELLKYPEVNPSAANNGPLILASENGYYNIVAILLKTGKVDPLARDGAAIDIAESRNHHNIALLLRKRAGINNKTFYGKYHILSKLRNE